MSNDYAKYRLIERLKSRFEFKESIDGNYLYKGICPSCGKKELYCFTANPYYLVCNRKNNCSFEGKTRDLLPELFDEWEKNFPATPQNPNATADAYLQNARGLNPGFFKGVYTQGNYFNKDKNAGTKTIKFKIADGVFWERLIDNVELLERKANFIGSYKGIVWTMPNFKLIPNSYLFITEGIFDAMTLIQYGINAVSTLSSNNFPETFLKNIFNEAKEKNVTIVFAYDNDKTGFTSLKRHFAKAVDMGFKVEAALIPENIKCDWNDAHIKNILHEGFLKKCYQEGELLLARSEREKAYLMFEFSGQREFPVFFDKKIYYFTHHAEKYQRELDKLIKYEFSHENRGTKHLALLNSMELNLISTCFFWPEYYQRNEITGEAICSMRIQIKGEETIRENFSVDEFSTQPALKKRLLSVSMKALFKGNQKHLDALQTLWANSNIKESVFIDYIGYSKECQAYIFNDVAVKDGKIYKKSEAGFFELPNGTFRTELKDIKLYLTIPKSKNYNLNFFIDHFYHAFKTNGIISLAFFVGALFAHQIRERQNSFPFLEVIGEPGSGKSTMIRFLWKLLGRKNFEGIDPFHTTKSALARYTAKHSNLPIIFIEADYSTNAHDWDQWKSAYNGGNAREIALKTSGNETKSLDFRGAMVIEQNREIDASDAMLERICQIKFTCEGFSQSTKTSAKFIEEIELKDVSEFILQVCKREKEILEMIFNNFPDFEKKLSEKGNISHLRIIKNHAQLMCLVQVLKDFFDVPDFMVNQAHHDIIKMAVARQNVMAGDSQIISDFWDLYEYLNETSNADIQRLNHSPSKELIAINLKHFEQLARQENLSIPDMRELKKVLKNSKRYKFVKMQSVRSEINKRINGNLYNNRSVSPIINCWIFEKPI